MPMLAIGDRVAWRGDVEPTEVGCPIGHVRYLARDVEVMGTHGHTYVAAIAALLEMETEVASHYERFVWMDAVDDEYLVRIDRQNRRTI